MSSSQSVIRSDNISPLFKYVFHQILSDQQIACIYVSLIYILHLFFNAYYTKSSIFLGNQLECYVTSPHFDHVTKLMEERDLMKKVGLLLQHHSRHGKCFVSLHTYNYFGQKCVSMILSLSRDNTMLLVTLIMTPTLLSIMFFLIV